MKTHKLIFVLLVTALLAGCTVGPRYSRPAVAAAPMDAYKEADGWKTAQPSDQVVRGKWWETFGDAQLNALEEERDGSFQPGLPIPDDLYDAGDRLTP
jgi:hypothetical protein